MIKAPTIANRATQKSILLVAEGDDTATDIVDRLPARHTRRIVTEATALGSLNGRGVTLFSQHDVILFDMRTSGGNDLDYLSKTIAQAGPDKKYLVLAAADLSISEAQKLVQAGVTEVVPFPADDHYLDAVFERLLSEQESERGASTGSAEVIAVAKARGGLGATTIAVNLARKLVGGGGLMRKAVTNRVGLVDLDLQFGDANALLDLEDNGAMLDLLQSGHAPDASYLLGMMQSHPSGLDLLSAPAPLVPLNSVTPQLATTMIDGLGPQYDYLVIDLPQALVDWIGVVLERADRIFIVTDTSVPSIRQAKRLMDFYQEENTGLQIEIVVNREARPMMKPAFVKEAESVLGLSLEHWLPDAPADARKAADLGQTVMDLKPKSRLGRGFGKLGDAVIASRQASAHAVT